MSEFENLLLRYFHYLDAKGRTYNVFIGLLWTGLIGSFDLLAPPEVSHTLFYLLPIAFVAWFGGFRLGVFIALLCTVLCSINNIVENPYITLWNIGTTLLFFTAIAALLKKTRQMWEKEKDLSRTDPLTGAKNLRAFSELVEHEMLRSQREESSYSLAYLDLDNFKYINDTFGHSAGDELLTTIVAQIVKNLRRTDMVGRLGGDEFAIFFPETDQAAVQLVMRKVSQELAVLMNRSSSTTTFSMGVITCRGVHNFNKMIKFVDSLMYEVKHSGKNNIRYALYPPD